MAWYVSLDNLDVEHHSGFVLGYVAVEHVDLLALKAVGEVHGAPHSLPIPKPLLGAANRVV